MCTVKGAKITYSVFYYFKLSPAYTNEYIVVYYCHHNFNV